jgi:hypothetical protein
MDFHTDFNPKFNYRKRRMKIKVVKNYKLVQEIKLQAYSESPSLPFIESNVIELCSLEAFSKAVKQEPNVLAFIGYVKFVQDETFSLDNPVLSGKGSSDSGIAQLLLSLKDILVSTIPPERHAADGSVIQHSIETAPTATPYSRPPRPFTREETQEIQRYISDFLGKGWIRPSLSSWAAPVLFVPKKPDPVSGKSVLRMVISFVKLNSKTLNRIAYRLPRISDLVARVSSAKYFSKLDLLDGYYQIRMKPDHIPKTAFTTPMGNFEFRVMPMGLCGAPSTFQYTMDEAFREPALLADGKIVPFEKFIAVYLDDVCIFSSTRQEHLLHISAVLQRLRERKLYVKSSKCEWLQSDSE